MRQFLHAIVLFAFLGEPLTRANHGYSSMSQLCRRLRVDEDLCRRAVAHLEERFHGPQIAVENHRLTLTTLGRRVWMLACQVRDLEENSEDAAETLSVEIAPCLGEALLPLVLPGFLAAFGGLLRLRICNLDAASVKQNIARRQTDFGMGFVEDGEARSGVEVLGARIPWVVLIPPGHKLQNGVGPVAGTDLRPDDRVYIPCEALTLPGLCQWLKGVESAYRVECDSPNLIRRLAARGLGLGVTLDLGLGDISDGLAGRPIAGVEEQRLCFYLPRRADDLSEAASALLEAIRRQVEILKDESRISTEPAGDSTPLPVGSGDFGALPLTSLEATKS
jgi:DNA-binding transcriptional LysR family regulator